MKKIPTLFKREWKDGRVVGISREVTPGCEWVLEGEGEATSKLDGACCAVINGEYYKRYDAKKGKKPPEGAIPCCDPDPVTGHWPHWVKLDKGNPADKWLLAAFESRGEGYCTDGTYEAVGPHFQGNPHGLPFDTIARHGAGKIGGRHPGVDGYYDEPELERTFDGIRKWFEEYDMEGIVFWRNGEPQCKIKRTDFGLEWPIKSKE